MEKVYLCDQDYRNFLANLQVLGSGFESSVYSLGSEVLKILKNDVISDELEKRISFLGDLKELREALTIPTKSVYLNRNFIGFFMNYAGVDLKKYLLENKISLEKRIQILRLIKDKLGFIHKFGIIHGDLQPKNIMIYNGNVRISDVVNMRVGVYKDILLNDMTLYLSKYFGVSSLLDLHSLNYITYILLNMPYDEMLEYLSMDACGYSYLIENGFMNNVFQDDVFVKQMDILINPKENKEQALEKSKYLIDYLK